jgi:LPXTG-site transpeptidase (sortase) family protein
VTFTVTVTNTHPTTNATNVEVTDIVPSGYTYVGGTIAGGSSRDDSDPAGTGLTWTINSLAPGAGNSVDLTFQATVNALGDFRNVAQVSNLDENDVDSSPANDDGDQSEDDEDNATIITAELGNYVWVDTNPTNGLQDVGEPGIAGVTVNLYGDVSGNGSVEPFGADGSAIGTTITDASGFYQFIVAPGAYLVEFVLPSGYTFTISNTGADDTIDSDAILQDTATIGDWFWIDGDVDGLQGGAETGFIDGMIVNLFMDADADGTVEPYGDDGNPVLNMTSGAAGYYQFVVPPGLYMLEAVPPTTWGFTTANAGADNVDSDFIEDYPSEGGSYQIIVNETLVDVISDFGIGYGQGGYSQQFAIDAGDNQIDIDGGLLTVPVVYNQGHAVPVALMMPGGQSGQSRSVLVSGGGKLAKIIINSKLLQVANLDQPSGRTVEVILAGGDSNLSFDAGVIIGPSGAGAGGTADGPDSLRSASLLPSTGFAPGEITHLPDIAGVEDKYLQYSNQLTIEIPSLGVDTTIVGVPFEGDSWDTTWLWEQAGYLDGTAFPTWEGNTAITAHSYLPNGEPGPFVNLGSLKWGDRVIVQYGNQRYLYEVRESYYVSRDNLSPLAHEDQDWLTLISCYQYDEAIRDYRWRVIARAKLVEVFDANTP